MSNKLHTKILLKLTGELIPNSPTGINTENIKNLAKQIRILLEKNYLINIVIGAGNFFRGAQQHTESQLSLQSAHSIGMVATMMNSIVIQDIFNSIGIPNTILSALQCPQIADAISNQSINQAAENNRIVIFAGGTGNPYYTTDTNAIIRALQSDCSEVWKGTKVNGIYTKDPKKFTDARLIKNISFDEAISKNLKVMDQTAFMLAKEHNLPIRVFDIFESDSLIKAAESKSFGSTIN